MSSEHLASAETELKGELGAAWDILKGASANYTDLGIARRFGGAAAAYSLRDIGAMNGSVVRVRREPTDTTAGIDDEERFSANQVSSGALEDWVNGKLESTLPADVATAAAAYSLRKVSEGSLVYTGDYSSGTDTISANTGNITVTGNNDGIFGKDNVLKIENDDRAVPQLQTSNSNYQSSTSGVVEFEYYVPSDHPIVGNYWHIGTNRTSGGQEIAYSKRGVKIVGGAWTTAKLFYGSLYGGTDKPTTFSTNGRRLITILDQEIADGIAVTISCEDGDLYYISSLTIKTYDAKAVRIRRSSDDIEVDVAFDSDGKVSASSAITNVAEQGGESGSTNATDLNGFLNANEQTVGSSQNGTGSVAYNSFSGDSNTGFTVTNSDAGTFKQAVFGYESGEGDVIVANFDLNITSGTPTIQVRTGAAIGTLTSKSNDATVSSSANHTVTLTCTGDGLYIKFLESDACTFSVSNFTIVSHTQGATVHTWYDQAGSNDAVQATAANQPKIAENGALLDDGVTFDGTDDFLQTSGQVLTNNYTGARSLYGVCKINTDSGYIFGDAGSGTNEGTSFYSDTASDKIFFTNGKSGTLVDYDNITTIEGSNFLISSNYNNNNTTTIHKNSNNNGYTQGTDTYNFTTSSQFTIGDRQGGSSAATRFNGSVQEIIAYNSDQSANRFKIESNINNYYGLYNDANDMAEAFRATAGTLTNESKDGFDLAVGTPTAYVGFEFNEKIANGDSVFISFNLDLTGGSGGDATPIMRLTKTTLDGTDSSNFINPSDLSQGFNSFELTSSDNDAKFFAISEGNDNVNISISDFKVSRIARDGFVQTWYDQSGNNRPMIQDNASEQPSIVENGGFVGGVKAKAATSDDTMQNLQVSTDGTTANFGTDDWASGANSKLGLMYVGKIDEVAVNTTQSIILGGGRGVSSFQSGGLSLQVVKGGDDTYRLTNERQGLTPSTMTTIVTLNTDDDMILYGTANNRDFTVKLNSTTVTETETADLDTRENQPLSLFGAYSGFNTRRYQNSSGGVCKECYLFAGDNISEVDTIATEINQHYNIY